MKQMAFLFSHNVNINLYSKKDSYFKSLLLLLSVILFLHVPYLSADNNSINGTCPGEIIEEMDQSSTDASHTENGAIGSGGNDRYRMTFLTAGQLDISATNRDSSKNENYYFYVSRNNCGNSDSDWNLVSAEFGKSHSTSVSVNANDTIYIRLQSDKNQPNKGRHSYALALDFQANTATDLSMIAVADAPDPVGVNQDITYTARIANSGGTAVNVELNATISAGTFTTAPTGWSCNGSGTATMQCTRNSDMNDGETEDVVFAFTAPSTAQSVELNASVGSDTPESNPGNETASATTTVNYEFSDPNFVQCGLFPSALNTWQDINRGNNDIVIDTDGIYAENVNGTGGANQEIQCDFNGTQEACSISPMTESVPTLPTFIASPESGNHTAASTETDTSYGDVTVTADVTFNPSGSYTNGNPVMLMDSLTITNGATVTFDEGDYWIGTLSANQNSVIRTNGKVRLFIGNNLSLNQNHLDINYDNGNGSPENLFIFVYGDFTWASQGGGYQQDIAAYVYTEGTYTGNQDTANSHFLGAVTAVGDINLNNNQEYTYDDSGLVDGWGACVSCVHVNFNSDHYDISENINQIGTTETVYPMIALDHAVGYDVTVHYHTEDGTAMVAAGDYIGVNDETVTIPAGDLNVSIPIHIYNDAPIELDEHFFVQLSDPAPSTSVCLGDVNRTQINILAQEDAPTCFEDDFSNGLDSKWRVLSSSGGFTPDVVTVNGDARLRITPDERGIATVITKDYAFTTSQNLIIVEFDYYAYGGCSGGGLGTYGADGIVNVLFDSSVGDSPTPGSFGGSMGYAQRNNGDPGFEGGWLGLGIDEYGNFGNCNEGRIGGLPGTSCDSGNGFNPQSHTNTAVIRGDGNGGSGYEYLNGVEFSQMTPAQPVVALKNGYGADGYYSGRYKMTVDARDPNHLYIRLERDLGDGNGYSVIIQQFDAKDAQYNQGTTPDLVRYAISGGTGGGCNNHELSWIKLRGNCAVYGSGGVYTTGPFEAWDVYRGDTDHDSYVDDKNISTKIAGKAFDLTIASMAADGQTLELKPNIDAKYALYYVNENGANIPYDGIFYDFNATQTNAVTHTFAVDKAYKEMYVRIQYCADQNTSGGMILKPYSDCNSQIPLWEGETVSTTTQGVHLRYHRSDLFSVRPHSFKLVPPSGTSLNLLHAGSYSNLTLYANSGANGQTQGTQEYNQTKSNLSLTTTKYMGDGTVDTGGLLYGTAEFGSMDFNMTHGISKNGSQTDVADITDDDIGKINVRIEDTDWAYVDVITGYTGNQNCNSASEPYGFKICGDINLTFIPDHFDVSGVVLNNHGQSTFTYLSNDWNMSAPADVTLTAKNASGDTTQNFRQAESGNVYYENPVRVNIVVNAATPSGTAITEHNISDSMLGFGQPSFSNGEYHIPWNETDLQKSLMIRSQRDQTTPVNPYTIQGADINVSVASDYNDSTAGVSDTIVGSANGSGSVTFLYGRVHAPRYKVASASGTLPAYFEFYYDVNPSVDTNTTLGGYASSSDRSPDAIYWYKNSAHQSMDGNITGISQYNSTDLSLSTNVGVTNGIQYFNYGYTGSSFPYRATLLLQSQSWLIYNRYDPAATRVEVPMELNSAATTGSSDTFNSVGDSDAVDTTNRPRRIQW